MVGCATLEQAADTYREALNMGGGAGIENLEAQVHFGLGQVYLARGLYCRDSAVQQADYEHARVAFEAVAGKFEAVNGQLEDGGAVLETRAGHSYGYLGTLAGLQKDNETAILMYLKAVDYAAPSQKIFYYGRLAQVYCDEGKAVEAARAYEQAIDLARLYGYARDVEDLTAKLEQLRAKDCP
jgi:tetratricopeptide (TPR) repeat protein